jgi:hypothetical protein
MATPFGKTAAIMMVSATEARVYISVPPHTKEQRVTIFLKNLLVTLLTEKVKLILPVINRYAKRIRVRKMYKKE